MQGIFEKAKAAGKVIIAVSDMYLPADFTERLLKKCGFSDISAIYMSCEYGKSKADGSIYELIKNKYKGKSILHIGDNPVSDVAEAQKHGIDICPYKNPDSVGRAYRCTDMSPVIGAAYRGVVNKKLYADTRRFAPEYEYGYIYGGLFVLAYCDFIRNYCKVNAVDKLIFLSRDGDIVKKVYDKLYPEDDTEYVYMSRMVATRLMAEHNRYDFFRRFIYLKINQGIDIRSVLETMGLEGLLTRKDVKRPLSAFGLSQRDELTDKNAERLKKYLIKNFDILLDEYKDFDEAAQEYYTGVLSGCKHAAVVDIGWAGSGALSLSYLAKKVWGLDCDITGIVAGTNTLHNTEPEASEIFLQSGKLVSFVFSQAHNRDIMKKHDPNKNYNVYWELLLSSPTRQFAGFASVPEGERDGDQSNRSGGDYSLSRGDNGEENPPKSDRSGGHCPPSGGAYKTVTINGKEIRLLFGKPDHNVKGMKRIQKGILDFVNDYTEHFKDYPFMFDISGRDAAAPMLLASSHNERYLKAIAKKFDFKIDVT